MRIPISKRLLLCAEQVQPGARVADIGTDHGYLGIYLLHKGIASHVIASDVREKPLAKAKLNAASFGVAEQMDFRLCSGLAQYRAGEVDTVICAGMGGDTIAEILAACGWLRKNNPMLILQPQTSGNDLRRWLGENGFRIEREMLVEDGGFLYFTLCARYGGGKPLSPGEQYVSPQLLASGSPLLTQYISRIVMALTKTVDGISRAGNVDEKRLAYYQTALSEVKEMQDALGS